MKYKILLLLILILSFKSTYIFTTVLITHGLGNEGASYYQKSHYLDLIKESAQKFGHSTICITWLKRENTTKSYAGILPQERVTGAVKIAKIILQEIKKKNEVILIGHSFGGQVIACASRLLNPKNKNLNDSFIYDLIYTIKTYLNSNQTRSIPIREIAGTIIWGWKISQKIIDVIEDSNLINQNLIKLVKQNLSLEFIEDMKKAWNEAFNEVQTYKKQLFKNPFDHKDAITKLYTIGTAYNGDVSFLPDMDVVKYHINFYSISDIITSLIGKKLAPSHPRTANISILFEPTKSFAPAHTEFCGNTLMAPWILEIPDEIKSKGLGGFEKFEWGKIGTIIFFKNLVPEYRSDV